MLVLMRQNNDYCIIVSQFILLDTFNPVQLHTCTIFASVFMYIPCCPIDSIVVPQLRVSVGH